MNQNFLNDVVDGLTAESKRLPSKYFYDQTGDALFVKIMNMPEYYLTDCEREIFESQKKAIIKSWKINEPFDLIELGAGDGSKTQILLKELLDQGIDFVYRPVDISKNAIDGLTKKLANAHPNLQTKGLVGDYFKMLESIKGENRKKVVLFLGSNMGNMRDEIATGFLARLSDLLNAGDMLQVGLDLIKSKEIVLPAYNDQAGITAAFNLNLLDRINRELGANFIREQWQHTAQYTEDEGVAKSYLKSLCKQKIHLESADLNIEFEEGELIHTEISRKYNREILDKLIDKTEFDIIHTFLDSKMYFANFLLKH